MSRRTYYIGWAVILLISFLVSWLNHWSCPAACLFLVVGWMMIYNHS